MDFAKEYWEEFEKLSIDLLKSYFEDIDETKISVKRTQSQKDGGYDGIVIISDTTNNVAYKILSESKLRAISSKDLPMSDFSKTLVIAINMAAHELYIFTNLHFSQETQTRIAKFSNMTNIKVNLMDIFHVTEELKKLPFEVKNNYSEALLDELENSKEKHPLNRRTDFQSENVVKALSQLIGNRRVELLKNTVDFMKRNSGIFVIAGAQGSGKTLFVQHLASVLSSDRPYLCTYVDMIRFSNINDFLIMLLSIIWQIDIIDITKFNTEDIEEITSYISDEEMSNNTKKFLFDIITSQAESYFLSTDIMYNCIMEYLHKVYVPILAFRKQILVFHNIEYATNLAKDILLMFLKRFYDDNIIIILEMRNEIISNQRFLERCKREVKISKEIEIPNFDYTEVMIYLKKKYSDSFSHEEMKIFEKICPYNPLLIDQTIELFMNGIIKHHLLDDSVKAISKLYNNPNYLGTIYEQYVNHVMCACDEETQECAASIAFMDGTMEVNYITALCQNSRETIKHLLETRLFIYGDNTLEIYHASILEPLAKMLYINDLLVRKEVYQKLYTIIDSINMLPRKKALKKLSLALELNKKAYLVENWETVCTYLIKGEDYEVALEVLKRVQSIIYNELDDVKTFSVQLYIFQCYLGQNIYNQDEINEYVNALDELIKKNEYEISERKIEEYLYLKAKYYLAIGNYKKLIKCVEKHNDKNAKLYCIQALGIKHLFGIDECLNHLKHGMIIFPNDKYIHYSYYDHLLSQLFKYNVSDTKECISSMKPYIDILSLEDRIHYKYNEQCVLFYNLDLENLNELTELLRMSFQNNLPVEQSRICNLIGQFYWFKNESEHAIEYFNEAANLQLYTNHQTYWWIAKTNLALLYYELNEKEKCNGAIYEIFEIYRRKEWHEIRLFFSKEIISTQTILLDKRIVSFLLLLSILYEIDYMEAQKILQEIFGNESTVSKVKWIQKEYLSSVFYSQLKHTSYYFSNHYMIKC